MQLKQTLAALAPGSIDTLAGIGYLDGVPARDAPAGAPQGVVRRPDGDLIVLDMWAHRIWRIDRNGIIGILDSELTRQASANDSSSANATQDNDAA